MTDVIVVGGGVVGASATYQLARNGLRVTLIDQTDAGQATAAGAGIISPGTGFEPGSAAYTLARKALDYYPALLGLLADDGETQTGYETVGALFIATNDEEERRLPAVLRSVEAGRAAGFKNIGEVSRLNASEARKLFPPLADIREAIYLPEAARVDGRLLRDALQRAAQRRGASMLHGTASLIRRDDRVVGVRVGERNIPADAVLLAAGAWSNILCEPLDINVPVSPQRGQILHLTMPKANTSRWPIVLGFSAHYILAFPENRIVAGATRESGAGYDPRITMGGVHEIVSEALRVAPGLANGTLHELRVGLRPLSSDGLPILGRIPGVQNVYIATGHGASGLQLGPYSGAMVADLLLGKAVSAEMRVFAPDRF